MIHQFAGICGVDPGPLTLRELGWMAEARCKQDWRPIASFMALRAELSRDPKRRASPFRAEDFDPYLRREIPKASIHVLKALLPKEQQK